MLPFLPTKHAHSDKNRLQVNPTTHLLQLVPHLKESQEWFLLPKIPEMAPSISETIQPSSFSILKLPSSYRLGENVDSYLSTRCIQPDWREVVREQHGLSPRER